MKNIDSAFLHALQEHQQGEVLTDLSVAMRSAVQAAKRANKPACLTLKVKFTPSGNAVALTAEVEIKQPKEAPFAGIFFADEACNLFRNDPLQPEMELKTVEAEPVTELRKAVAS